MTHFVNKIPVRPLRRYSAKAVFATGLLMFLSFFMHSAIGYCSITVMPMEVQLKMPVNGARITDDMEVYNRGDTPIHVTASVMDWDITEKGDHQFYPSGTKPRSCATWIQLNPMSFSVPPKKSVRVRYSIAPPHEITEEHWAMVFFQTRAIPTKSDGVGINVSTRIGSKVFIVPNQPQSHRGVLRQGRITDIDVQSLSPTEIQSAAVTVARKSANSANSGISKQEIPTTKIKVVFQNTGPVSVRLTGTVEVRDTNGNLAARGVLPSRTQVLSGTTRELWAHIDKPLTAGTYHFRAVIDYGAKELVSGELEAQVDEHVTPALNHPTHPVSSVQAK